MFYPDEARWHGPASAVCDGTIAEELRLGGRRLLAEFDGAPMRYAGRGAALFEVGQTDSPVVLLRSGFAFRAAALPDGRRAILDLLIPGDLTGIDHLTLASPVESLIAANRIGYQALAAARVRELLPDRGVALRLMLLLAEARWRSDRLAASIGRLDAEGRICVMLLDIHDRLQRRGMIEEPRFNLPLTQEKIGDHLGLTVVHVNRVLKRLRDERIAAVDRQTVVIEKLDRLRELARGLPQPPALTQAYAAAAAS